MPTSEFIPYTYLIGWTKLNLWYYGARYANSASRGIANPSDLFVTYFTSSKLVKEMREMHGEPDVIQVRRTFKTAKEAITWEAKVCNRMDTKNTLKFLNLHNGDGKFSNAGISPSDETRSKIGAANRGKTPTAKTREKLSERSRSHYAANPKLIVTFYHLDTQEEVVVTNLSEFCRTRDLNHSGIRNVVSGRQRQHRGWATSLELRERRSTAKTFHFFFEGEPVTVINLRKFCKENNLNATCLCLVHSGKQKSHKGYTKT
jgi:hypothetical protein